VIGYEIGEQAVAHGAAGRAVLKWKVVRRGPVNGVVNTDTARDQRVDPVALLNIAVPWRRAALVVDCVPCA